MKDSMGRGETPLCGHLLYPQILNDDLLEERALGIQMHLELVHLAKIIKVYDNFGVSDGMQQAIDLAKKHQYEIEYRSITWTYEAEADLPEMRG